MGNCLRYQNEAGAAIDKVLPDGSFDLTSFKKDR
jgi:hypothetical protein